MNELQGIPMDDLPFVDEHSQHLDMPADATWSALLRVLRRQSRGTTPLARLLGCEPEQGTPEFTGKLGDSVPGFRVVEVEPGRRLELRGRHRFAQYALTFILGDASLRAQTHAVFSGIVGRLYRTAVIGTGVHRVVTKAILRRVARSARQQTDA
jgi:hypothetical protein